MKHFDHQTLDQTSATDPRTKLSQHCSKLHKAVQARIIHRRVSLALSKRITLKIRTNVFDHLSRSKFQKPTINAISAHLPTLFILQIPSISTSEHLKNQPSFVRSRPEDHYLPRADVEHLFSRRDANLHTPKVSHSRARETFAVAMQDCI